MISSSSQHKELAMLTTVIRGSRQHKELAIPTTVITSSSQHKELASPTTVITSSSQNKELASPITVIRGSRQHKEDRQSQYIMERVTVVTPVLTNCNRGLYSVQQLYSAYLPTDNPIVKHMHTVIKLLSLPANRQSNCETYPHC